MGKTAQGQQAQEVWAPYHRLSLLGPAAWGGGGESAVDGALHPGPLLPRAAHLLQLSPIYANNTLKDAKILAGVGVGE